MSAHKSDVVVIGGGLVGLCSAWFLHKAGASVTVVSRDPLTVGASIGNAGMIVPSHLVPLAAPGVIAQGLRYLLSPRSPFYIKPRLDRDLIRWLWAFRGYCTPAHVRYAAPVLRDHCMASVQLLDELQLSLGEFGWKQTGLFMHYRTEKYRTDNLHAADIAEAHGLRIRRLDADGTRAVDPGVRGEILGSVLYEDDGRVVPDQFVDRLRTALEAAGVSILEGTAVERIAPGAAGRVRLQITTGTAIGPGSNRSAGRGGTTKGTVEADTVVLAAGAWSGRMAAMLGIRIPIQPAKGYSITVPAPEDGPSIPAILSEEKVTITPMPGRIRFGGTLALSGFDSSVDPRRIEPIRDQLMAHVPGTDPATLNAGGAWSGFRPASPDGLPIIGRSKRLPSVVLATGHGMMGVTLAPSTGRMVAELVTGAQPSLDPTPVRPGRFD